MTDDFESNIYYDRTSAEDAVKRLYGLGYDQSDIGVMMDDRTREQVGHAFVDAKGNEGVAAGATIGGVLGAIVAGITATGSIAAIAGTGGAAAPLVAGPLVAALAGLGVGAAGGGIVGGLVGLGVGTTRAKEYEKGLREGGIVVAVRPKTKEHRRAVARALGTDTETTTGIVEPTVDYVGETRQVERNR